MAERRPKAKSLGAKNRLDVPKTCVSEVAARIQPVKAGSWKGDNPVRSGDLSFEAMLRKYERKCRDGRRCGEKPHDRSAESVWGAISGKQVLVVKSVKRSARALWVVKVVSPRAKCVVAIRRRLTCLHTECRNGRHGGSSPVSRRFFFDIDAPNRYGYYQNVVRFILSISPNRTV